MRPDQERVKNLLTDTVTLLCKNGLQFDKELKVQGLLGITTDENDVFVVHINQKFGDAISASITVHSASGDSVSDSGSGVVDLTERDRIRPRPQPISRARKRRSRDSDSSPRVGSPHRPHSPAGNSETENVSGVRIKKEERASPAGCRDGERPRKQYSRSGDDRDAMRETYSNLSLSDIQSGFEFEPISGGGLDNGSGGPPAKRRTLPPGSASTSRPPEHAASPAAGPFVTGIVRHSDQGGSSSDAAANVPSWDSSNMGDLGDMTGDGSLDEAPGHSSWNLSQGGGEMQGMPLQPGDDSVAYPFNMPPPRRPRNKDRPFVCCVEGCGRRFYWKADVYRHQREKHGFNHLYDVGVEPSSSQND